MSGTAAVQRWLAGPRRGDDFPYGPVVAEIQHRGKHFLSAVLLDALRQARSASGSVVGDVRPVLRFLNIVLDKADGRYDYRTYLALDLLPMPGVDDGDLVADAAAAQRCRDRLVVALIADLLRFEDACLNDGQPMPQRRPGRTLAAKRIHLGWRVLHPSMVRLGLAEGLADDVLDVARLWEAVEAELDEQERRAVALSMQPVARVHDEYLFLRVLQAWETTFALVAVDLSAVTELLRAGHAVHGVARLEAATAAMKEAAPLFSLLATMQVDAFHDFRRFTEGASAIQSYHYKLVESLCRRPELARLGSVAYEAVPSVRVRSLAGQPTVQSEFTALETALPTEVAAHLKRAMASFAAAMTGWRRTHYSLALRMLGANTAGTGATSGTAYLKQVKDIPVFNASSRRREAPRDGR
ncbi:tryptophan 2,3-dioxygenase family protein [Micromonospora chokoriensis]